MAKLAVIKTGGKQYLVKEGDEVKVEKTRDKKGKITFSNVLLYKTDKQTLIAPKELKKVKVKGKIKEIGKGEKVKIVKHKPKKGYLKKKGHRQLYMNVKIDKIVKSG